MVEKSESIIENCSKSIVWCYFRVLVKAEATLLLAQYVTFQLNSYKEKKKIKLLTWSRVIRIVRVIWGENTAARSWNIHLLFDDFFVDV